MANNKFHILNLLFSLLFFQNSFSQQYKYFVYFSDKDDSPFSLHNPSEFLSSRSIARRESQGIEINYYDLPVIEDYLDSLRSKGCQVLIASKWLNGAMVLATPSQLSELQSFSFVKSASKANRLGMIEEISSSVSLSTSQLINATDYGPSYNQIEMIGVDKMHQRGFAGNGKLIAVIDGGFKNANQLRVFDSLFLNNKIVSTYDFVDDEPDVYDDDPHGTNVLSIMAGYLPGKVIGPAWQSEFLLLRSEDNTSESLSEEYYWIRAAEYADSCGADIISSSLGYNQFDDGSLNHSYSDLTGDKAPITIAADFAASKGILVVNSAGNEGNNAWHYIFTPADGDSVLTVGAVTASGGYYNVSSVGPTADGRTKPDLVAQGNGVYFINPSGNVQSGNGTSFSTPLIVGLAAGLWQEFPTATNMDIFNYLKLSASRYSNPDNKVGYGIPNYEIARELIAEKDRVQPIVYPNPVGDESIKVILPNVEISKKVDVMVYDSKGRKVLEESIYSICNIVELNSSLANYQPGLYVVVLKTEIKVYRLKVIKK